MLKKSLHKRGILSQATTESTDNCILVRTGSGSDRLKTQFCRSLPLPVLTTPLFPENVILIRYIFLFLLIIAPQSIFAHQQPTTIVLLDVNPDKVAMELEIPLTELELAFGNDVTKNTDTLLERLKPQISEYLKSHIQPVTGNQKWSVEITDMKETEAIQTQDVPFQEIKVSLNLIPPTGVDTRNFTLNYDVIMHQVVTHKALVSIRNDWENGVNAESPVEAGVLTVDNQTGKALPIEINLEKGSFVEGFKSMVALGMRHIKEGTDHLLFLLVLLLPATLLSSGKSWGEFGGTKYSVTRLLKIVTAFTVGHSITLLIGALNLFQMPQQPVEVLIAVSILVSAVHAVRPIFPGKEMYVAAGFGLIHGLAFATVLADLNLDASRMALSILGFNIGIELMQLFVIALIVPWFILIAQTKIYKPVRIVGALLSSVAAIAWIAERVSGKSNVVADAVQNASECAPFGILALAFIALAAFVLQNIKHTKPVIETQK